VRLLKGDIVRLETSGGGGFGDPTKRSAERRQADHALGYVKG
jgi:N-methylhydantoinase B